MFLSRRATKLRQTQRNGASTIDFGVRRLHFRLFLNLIRKVQQQQQQQQQFSSFQQQFSSSSSDILVASYDHILLVYK